MSDNIYRYGKQNGAFTFNHTSVHKPASKRLNNICINCIKSRWGGGAGRKSECRTFAASPCFEPAYLEKFNRSFVLGHAEARKDNSSIRQVKVNIRCCQSLS